MKKVLCILICVLILTICILQMIPESAVPETTTPETTVQDTLPPETTIPQIQPEHSMLYIPGLSVEDVIRYFNEVVLDAEIVNGGDPSRLQKWNVHIYYIIDGDCTEKDREVLADFVKWLNTIEGFPGILETTDWGQANMRIYFLNKKGFENLMGTQFAGTDGGVTFWYRDNAIYDAKIGYRTDIGQDVRNSVILEEIYNGLGPVQDTALREDSIIYAGYSTPQSLTEIDELILKLLYHPQMLCGMNAEECEAVIRELYY